MRECFCCKRSFNGSPPNRFPPIITSGDGRQSLTASERERERERDASMADEAVKSERRSQVGRGMGRREEEGEGKVVAGADDGRSRATLLMERRRRAAGMMADGPVDCDVLVGGERASNEQWEGEEENHASCT